MKYDFSMKLKKKLFERLTLEGLNYASKTTFSEIIIVR